MNRGEVTRAARFVAPFLALGLVWAFSNPPGASPDESDHLIKSLGAARLDLGDPYRGPPATDDPIGRRNASISRDISIPASLAPDGFACTAFDPQQTAACQDDAGTDEDGNVIRTTSMGAYPVFEYIPIGLVARLAPSAATAFLLGRVTALALSMTFLLGAAWHLHRWLGRAAALGLLIGLTPMALFTSGQLSTSGLEILSATALASVVVVCTRHPESLADGPTLALAAGSASALAMSRQLGMVTVAVFALLALFRGGAPVLLEQLRTAPRRILAAGATVGLSLAAVIAWELRYDHPVETGPPWEVDALGAFFGLSYHYLQSGIGNFGWLDTPLPGIGIATWSILAALVLAGGGVLGHRADRWSLVYVLLALVVVAYVVHATVFFPIQAGLQGRHLLPLFSIAPLLAWIMLVERLLEAGLADAVRRLFALVGVSVAALHLGAVLVNARRYAVGAGGPVVFLSDAEWSPPLGWVPWIVVAAVASAALAVAAVRTPPDLAIGPPGGGPHVER